jgi:hypothetical protein
LIIESVIPPEAMERELDTVLGALQWTPTQMAMA